METDNQNETSAPRGDGSDSTALVSEWTQDEVTRFAAEQNYNVLYQFCLIHRQNPHMLTWEQAMQSAAVEMAKQLDEVRQQLIECKLREPISPILSR